jgi:hypothetical protein
MQENSVKSDVNKWWHTDCQFCRKYRRIFLWIVVMFAADAFWFHLVF